MGALTSIVAGVATVVGVVALARYAERRLDQLRGGPRDKADEEDGAVIELHRDPVSGAYKVDDENVN